MRRRSPASELSGLERAGNAVPRGGPAAPGARPGARARRGARPSGTRIAIGPYAPQVPRTAQERGSRRCALGSHILSADRGEGANGQSAPDPQRSVALRGGTPSHTSAYRTDLASA